jgi:hypothetical protein
LSTAADLPLIIHPHRLAVCRLPAEAAIPDWARPGDLLAVVRTRDELSVLCEERYVPPEVKAERGWRALQVQGPLDFSMVGVLSSILAPLAQAALSVLALSTYDTDYILVRDGALERTVQILRQEGFLVLDDVGLSA